MIFWVVLKLEISYRVIISWRILVCLRWFFEDYIFACWNIWVSIILLLPLKYFLMYMAGFYVGRRVLWLLKWPLLKCEVHPPMRENIPLYGGASGYTTKFQGVCQTVALPFPLKKVSKGRRRIMETQIFHHAKM